MSVIIKKYFPYYRRIVIFVIIIFITFINIIIQSTRANAGKLQFFEDALRVFMHSLETKRPFEHQPHIPESPPHIPAPPPHIPESHPAIGMGLTRNILEAKFNAKPNVSPSWEPVAITEQEWKATLHYSIALSRPTPSSVSFSPKEPAVRFEYLTGRLQIKGGEWTFHGISLKPGDINIYKLTAYGYAAMELCKRYICIDGKKSNEN
jgi:hypothetical protein